MSLALKSPVLENCPILGLRTAVFFELLGLVTVSKIVLSRDTHRGTS